MRSALRDSQARSSSSALEVGRVREKLLRSQARCEELQAKMSRMQRLKAEEGPEMEVRELRYKNTHLARELRRSQEAAGDLQARTRAKLHGFSTALNQIEGSVAKRGRLVRREMPNLRSLLATLQRRLLRRASGGGAGGRAHDGEGAGEGSHTTQKLLAAVWESVEVVAQISDCPPPPTAASTAASRERRRRRYQHVDARGARGDEGDDGDYGDDAGDEYEDPRDLGLALHTRGGGGLGGIGGMIGEGGESGGRGVDGDGPATRATDDIARTMADICEDLESENRRLRALLREAEAQVEAARVEAKASALIPQYVPQYEKKRRKRARVLFSLRRKRARRGRREGEGEKDLDRFCFSLNDVVFHKHAHTHTHTRHAHTPLCVITCALPLTFLFPPPISVLPSIISSLSPHSLLTLSSLSPHSLLDTSRRLNDPGTW